MTIKSRFIPCLAYRDAGSAINWLCDALGFEVKVNYQSDDGKVQHAELTYQGNMIMVASSDRGVPSDQFIRHPQDMDGKVTQSPYIIIDEDQIDEHYERAKNHGAKMAYDLKAQDYGGKMYSCYDPEGHLWNFGSFDPWAQ